MGTINKEQIDTLVRLQDVEQECREAIKQLERIPEQIESLDRKMDETRENMAGIEELLVTLRKDYRAFESDVQENQSQMDKSQEKLRSVKTNKEYQSILKEIDDLKKKNSSIEDEMIVCLDRIEEAETSIEKQKEDLEAVSKSVGDEKSELLREAEGEEHRLEELEAKRSGVAAAADAALLARYISVKEKKGGIGIAPVTDAVCHGCNMNIPPQMYNELQRYDTLKFCPFCDRIIYWKETSE